MKTQGRRDFIKTLAAFGVSGVGISASFPTQVEAVTESIPSENLMGVLVDTTACIGCRKCEWACKRAHQMESGSIRDYNDRTVFQKPRRLDHNSLTIVNQYPDDESKPSINVKIQCMHCDYPACVSACIVGALSKKKSGAVVWDGNKCIGCRYCMVACPFQIPAFDYHKAIEPEIRKCDFCVARTSQGKLPACVSICPVEALAYGPRSELTRIARDRIKKHPDRYNSRIFGETEVGGTSWLYLSAVEFKQLGFPRLDKDPAPIISETIQHGVFKYFIPPVGLYVLLGGVMWITRDKDERRD